MRNRPSASGKAYFAALEAGNQSMSSNGDRAGSNCPLLLPMNILLAGVVLCVVPPTLVKGQDIQVTSTPVGDPTWTDTDFHLISEAVYPFPAAFRGVLQSAWPLHAVGEHTPHLPPYDMEVADALATSGFEDKSTFQVEEILGDPLGVYFFWMTIPNPGGPTGSDRYFESGPIIANDVLPYTRSIELHHGGGVLNSLRGTTMDEDGFDGRSHIVTVMQIDATFFPDDTELLGDYEIQLSRRDSAGNGYDHSVSFEVIPEPSTVAISLVAFLSVFALRRKRA